MIKIYGILMSLIYTLVYPYLRRRYKIGFDERTGFYAPEKIIKNAIWVHAVSVGEVQAAVPFISEMKKKFPDEPIILSTTTPTGAKMAVSMKAKCDLHIYYPWDTPAIITRAFDTLKPRAFVAVESEIWPLFITELKRRNIPSFLINGRISDRSFKRMKKFAHALAGVLSCFERFMVREEIDAQRLRELGVDDAKIIITGDCKIDAMMERVKEPPLRPFGAPSPSPTAPPPPGGEAFIAGSTHPGEDEQILEAFDIVKKTLPSARLIIVPRHPERAADIIKLTQKNPYSKWEILVVDKIGVLFGLYGIACAAFVGGSLVPKGGQNLMEPALFGTPVCHGRYMDDFRYVANEFDSLGISKETNSAAEIADFWIQSATDGEHSRVAAKKWFDERKGAAKKCADIIKNIIG